MPWSDVPYIIRLRDPWEVDRLPLEGQIAEKLRFRRHFNAPTGLLPADQIQVVIESPRVDGEAEFNGAALGTFRSGETASFAIHSRLQSRNEVQIVIVSQPGDDWKEGERSDIRRWIGEVSLQIRSFSP